jgi:hypothetical protein
LWCPISHSFYELKGSGVTPVWGAYNWVLGAKVRPETVVVRRFYAELKVRYGCTFFPADPNPVILLCHPYFTFDTHSSSQNSQKYYRE